MNIKEAVSVVEAHPDYRVLRRFVPQYHYKHADDFLPLRRGLYIDTETTGTNTETADVLEIALVPFIFQEDGEILAVLKDECVAFLNDPGKPLDETIRKLTGISDQDLKGQELDYVAIAGAVAKCELIIAHNAGYDRKIVERYVPTFRTKPWACSQQDVPWRTEFEAPAERLEILARFLGGLFYGAHRAMVDCQIGVHLLATVRDEDGHSAFSHLLRAYSQESIRVWAVGSPFHTKDALRARGYRWNDGTDGRPKAWNKNISHEELEEENKWLRTEVGAYPQVTITEAIDRYSVRDK